MKEHDHKVAFYESSYDSGSWLVSASIVERRSSWNDDGERFGYCPECGASLAAFWQETDAARLAYRQELDREEQHEQQEREREQVYSNTSPT